MGKNAIKTVSQSAKRLKTNGGHVANQLMQSRIATAKSITEFCFNSKRVKLLAGSEMFLREGKGVAYYMHRDQRLQDNWAALYAQKLALENKLPLYVIAGISMRYPENIEATRRKIDFALGGLQEVASDCMKLGIGFHLLQNYDKPMHKQILSFMDSSDVDCIVADFSPLKQHRDEIQALQKVVAEGNHAVLYQVDAHNIVPVWETSDKQEYAARTIRPKIMKRLDEFLTEFPPLISHPVKTSWPDKPINWNSVCKSISVDESVKSCEWASPGTLKGYEMLQSFVADRLKIYESGRNDPNLTALSNLSPWFHFGQLSSQRAALYVREYGSAYKSAVDAFIEESVVRSELAENFCYYQPNYDNLKGATDWAIKSLNDHKNDF